MNRPIGVRVFPSRNTDALRTSTGLLHYTVPLPPEEPPIDYTVRVKPKIRSDYRVVFQPKTDPLEEVYGAESYRSQQNPGRQSDIFKSSIYEEDEQEPSHRIQEVLEHVKPAAIPSLPARLPNRRSTVDQKTQQVLDDLDNVLDEDDQLTFEQIRDKVKSMNLSFRPYPSQYSDEEITEEERRLSEDVVHSDEELSHRIRRIAVSPSGTKRAPVMTDTVIEDLKSIPQGIQSVAEINEHRRQLVEQMHRNAQLECLRARQQYTPEFFFDQTPEFERNSRTRTPGWKRILLAKKYAVEAIRQHEERVWYDFDEWKRQFEPNYRKSPQSSYTSHSSMGSGGRLS